MAMLVKNTGLIRTGNKSDMCMLSVKRKAFTEKISIPKAMTDLKGSLDGKKVIKLPDGSILSVDTIKEIIEEDEKNGFTEAIDI